MLTHARVLFVLLGLSPFSTGCGASDDVAGSATTSATAQPLTAQAEQAKLEGVWEVVQWAHLGVSKRTYGERYEFDANRFRVFRRSDGVGPWRTYRLIIGASPKGIEGLVAGTSLRAQPGDRRAIYRFEKSELRVCFSMGPGTPPPADFRSEDCDLVVLRRLQPLPRGVRVGERDAASEKKIQTAAYYRLQTFVSRKDPDGRYDIDFHEESSERALRSSHWQDLVDLREIRLLRLRGCSYVGDREMKVVGSLTAVEQLDLHATDVTDSGVAELVGLDNLKHLDLSMTSVTDAGLATISRAERLETLILSGAAVTQTGIAELRAKQPKLEVVWTRSYTDTQRQAAIALSRHELEIDDVSDRYLESTATTCRITIPLCVEIRDPSVPPVPEDLRRAWHTTSLTFEATVVAKYLAQLPAPTVVVVGGAGMDDSIFVALRDVQGLTRLSLERTLITDAGIPELRRHPDLKMLQLTSAKRLTDEGMANLGPLPKLEELWVQGIDLTPAGAESLLRLGALKRLSINREALSREVSAKFAEQGVKVQRR